MPKQTTKHRGALIVLEGTDGSGKATQAALLTQRLEEEGHTVRTIDFPQYDSHVFGKLVGECLAGERGDFMALDPYITSTLYAADRFEAKETLEEWLAAGYVVIADRYTSANQIHQGAKITDARKRRTFLKWLDTMEYGVFGLPRPDMIVYLDMPVSVSLELLRSLDARSKKRYTKSGRDLAEADHKHLEAGKRRAMKIVGEDSTWTRIRCARGRTPRSREEVHADVYEAVRPLLSN